MLGAGLGFLGGAAILAITGGGSAPVTPVLWSAGWGALAGSIGATVMDHCC